MGVRSTQAVTQTVANATDPNVAAYFTFNQRSAGPYNGLVVPFGCAAAGTIFTQHGTPTYGQTGPNGLPAVTFNGTTDFFSTTGNAPAALIPGSSALVIEVMVKATVTGVNQEIVSSFASGIGWGIYIDTIGRPGILLGDGTNLSTDTAGSAGAVTDGNFHYIRMSWPGAGTAPSISFDGNAPVVSSKIINAVNQVANVSIAQLSNNTNRLTGSIANLRITIGNSTNNLGYNTTPVRAQTVLTQKSGATSDPNVAAYLPLDQPTTPKTLVVPNGYASAGKTLPFRGGTPTFGLAGPAGLGGAARFDGSNYYRTNTTGAAGNGFDFGSSSGVVEATVSFNTFDDVGGTSIYTLGGYNAAVASGHNISVTATTHLPQFQIAGGGLQCVAAGTTPLVIGTFYSLRGVWDTTTGTATLFVNGIQVGSTTVPAMIGVSTASPRFFWFGTGDGAGSVGSVTIADFRITIGNSTNNLGYNTNPGRTSDSLIQRPGNVTDPNVAAYFNMEQTSGNLVVPAGCSLAGAVATKGGSPTYGVTAGVPKGLGKAIQFNGGTDTFSANTVSFFKNVGTQDFVVEFWAQTNAPASNQAFINQGGFSINKGGFLSLIYNNGTAWVPSFSVAATGVGRIQIDGTSQLDTNWHYYRCTWVNQTGTFTVYIDDALIGQSSLPAMIGATVDGGGRNFTIGFDGDQAFGLNGQIADIRLTFGNATNHSGYNSSGRAPTY